MEFNTNDYIGFTGVFINPCRFACLASRLIHYIPFVILEGTWTLVSFFSLINHFLKR